MDERGARLLRGATCAAQEGSEVARDGRVLRIGKAQRGEADAALGEGRGVDRDFRKEALHDASQLAEGKLGAQRPAHQPAPPAGDRERHHAFAL